MRPSNLFLIPVGLLLGTHGTPVSGQTVSLVPKSSTLLYVINGDEIITTAGATVDLEFTATGWGQAPGNPKLGGVGATIDPSGYLGANAQPPNPGVDLLPLGYALPDPNGGTRQLGLFAVQNVCSISNRDCTTGQGPACVTATEGFCVPNPRLVFYGHNPLPIFERTSLLNYFAAQIEGAALGGVPDDNDPNNNYFGTLRLVVPAVSSGTYTIGLDPDLNLTMMIDAVGVVIWNVVTVPARITVVPAIPPQPAFGPHDIVKNRYVSFVPAGGEVAQAYQVRLAASTFDPGAVGFVGWVGAPSAGPNSSSLVQTSPVFRVWDEFVVHVGDCEIQPGATYEIRGTTDGIVFSTPLVIETAAQPSGGKEWGDIAGVNDGLQWTAPNGIANVHDILAIRSLITLTDPIPPFYRVNLQATSSADSCLNSFVNTADTFMAILAVSGQPYPFVTDPALCPVCP